MDPDLSAVDKVPSMEFRKGSEGKTCVTDSYNFKRWVVRGAISKDSVRCLKARQYTEFYS